MEKRTSFDGRASFILGRNRKWRVSALRFLACGPVLVAGYRAGAAILTWDPGNTPATPTDGSGFWDVSNSLSNPDSNWSNGATDSAWVNGSTAAIGNGGAAGTVTIDDSSGAVTASAVTFNAVSSGSYVVTNSSGQSLALTGTAAVPAPVTVATGTSATISAPISGANGLTLVGPGSLNLSGANTYGGNTVLNSGTLNLNAGGTLGSGAGLVMGIIGAQPNGTVTPLTTVSTLLINTNASVSSFTVNTNTATFNTLSIGSANTLTVSGSFSMTLNPKLGSGTDHTNLLVTGAGTLNVANSSNSSFQVGTGEVDGSNPTGSESATLNMGGLTNFAFSTATGEFDVGNGAHGQGVVTLANTSNSITAATVRVGDSSDGTITGNAGSASSLSLGTGTNVIDANSIIIGSGKDTGTINFAGANGSVTINNEAGTGSGQFSVGVGGSGSSTANGTANFSGHMLTMSVGALDIGDRNSGNAGLGAIGSFVFDTGTVNVSSNVQLAHDSGSTNAGPATATLTVGNTNPSTPAGNATLNVTGGFILGTSLANAASVATGTFNVEYGGVANINAQITNSVVASTLTGIAHSTINIAGGTLNMEGNAIGGNTGGTTITLNTTGGELINVGTINTTGGVTMATAGNTLTIAGANSWTGPTNLTAGTMVLANSPGPGALGNTVVNVGSGTTFIAQSGTSIGNASSATLGGSLIASANAMLSLVDNTVGTLDLVQGASFGGTALGLAGDTINMDLGATGPDELFVNGPGSANISGNNTINLSVIPLSMSIPTGTFPLITGNGSANFTGNFAFSNSSQTETVMDANNNSYVLTLSNSPSGEFLTIVPEPATVGGVVMLGMVMLGKRRRRSRG